MIGNTELLHVALSLLAGVLLVVGFMINNTWSPLLYSLGLMAMVVLVRFTWVQQAGWVSVIKYPDSPSNGVILCKLIVSLVVQLATIYYASKSGYPILGAIAFGLSAYGWMCEEAYIPNSDPAGNGMAKAFDEIINIAASVILALIFYFVQRRVQGKYTLEISVAVIALYFMCKVFGGYYSRTVGRAAEYERSEEERWEKIRKKREASKQDGVRDSIAMQEAFVDEVFVDVDSDEDAKEEK